MKRLVLIFLISTTFSVVGYSQNYNYDVNGDGEVTAADITAIYDYLLGNVPVVTMYNVNGVIFKMVQVDGGTFTMGDTSDPAVDGEYDIDERPPHQVTLNTFLIGQTEVTQELWQAVMGSTPSYFSDNPLHPVENVSWNDCQQFIVMLNQMTGRNFRLPTEAEWEYAARGGNRSQGFKWYSGSNMIDDVAWYWDNIPSHTNHTAGFGTQTVATKLPNELGIYDMSGNVYEWCQDWYGSYSAEAQTNPTGPASGSSRVLRGGAWSSDASDCRVSNRISKAPDNSNNFFGLRLAL